jgi:hypothetical protein
VLVNDPFAKVDAGAMADLPSESGAEPTGDSVAEVAQDSPAEAAVESQQEAQDAKGTQPEGAKPQPDADPWGSQEAKELLKGKTPQELKRILEREKNLLADYTKKTQRVSDERRQLAEQQKAIEEHLKFIQSDRFKRLKDLDDMYRDPTTQAKIDKVLEEMGTPADKVVDIKLKNMEDSLKGQIEQLRKEREAIDMAAREQRALALRQKLLDAAEKRGVDPDMLHAAVASAWNKAQAAGVQVDDEVAFMEEAADDYVKRLDEYAENRSKRLYQQKLEQQKVSPLKGSAVSAPAGQSKDDKIKSFDDPRLMAVTRKYLGEA